LKTSLTQLSINDKTLVWSELNERNNCLKRLKSELDRKKGHNGKMLFDAEEKSECEDSNEMNLFNSNEFTIFV
jgi:hypothetical protein